MSLSSRRITRFVIGAGLFAASLAEARRGRLPEYEERIFRFANGAPAPIRVPVRAVMQAGTFGAVPAASALAFIAGRRRLAGSLALGGTLAWFGAKLAKPFGGRERPHALLPDVVLRERIEGDLGWVSGHATVATTMALVGAEELPQGSRPILAAIVATVGFGRMYVGAHLPLDVVGGVGLGMMISAVLPSAEGD